MSDERLEEMHSKKLGDLKTLFSWVNRLKHFNVFYSSLLDLDFLMLTHYAEFYKKAVPEGGGPRIPDKNKKSEEFEEKVKSAVQATLKSEKATGETYSDKEKELMIWYNYHFLGRGKPTTHIQVLSSMTNRQIKASLPPIFKEIFDLISSILNPPPAEDEES